MKIVIDGIEFDVIISKKKIKNIYFRIKEDLKIYVSCSYLCSNKYIEKLLIDNGKDLIKMYNNMAKKFIESKEIYYLGNKLNYEYDTRVKIDENNAYGPSLEKINEYIEKNSIKIFEERLNRLKVMFDNLPNFKLKTRCMKTRWGVCNRRNMTITLNTLLIHKDVTLIDYVIIHELCHFYEANHSSRFWKQVELRYPKYKEARKRMKVE